MKLIVKIIISVAVAAVAAALTTLFAGDGHAAPVLFVAFCCATVITALLVSIPGSKSAPEPPQKCQKSQRPPRQAATEIRTARYRDGREAGTRVGEVVQCVQGFRLYHQGRR